MDLSTARWQAVAASLLYALLALVLLRDALPEGRVALGAEGVAGSLPWADAAQTAAPVESARSARLDDQARSHYPALFEAARVYRGEADALWTSRAGGGQPLLGQLSSSLLHPRTLLAAVLPLDRVPLAAGLLVLIGSALLTYLFLRRLSASFAAALLGGLAFGFGGHQVLSLHAASASVLIALPLCCLAVERLVEDRTRRRQAVLALSFALLVLGGHAQTALVAGTVAGLWALYRLWDAHGRFVVAVMVLLAAGLSAVQWWPFVESVGDSHALWLRRLDAAGGPGGASLGAGLVFLFFLGVAWTLLAGSAERGFLLRVGAIVACVVALVMARRMGLAVSGLTVLFPGLYGDPRDGGAVTGARDFAGLSGGFVGALPPLLLAIGAVLRLGGGFTRFFATGSFVLWGAAFHMPAVEGGLRHVPGFGHIDPVHLLGPFAFLVACGGAWTLDRLAAVTLKPSISAAARRVTVTLVIVVIATLAALRVPVDPHGGRTLVSGLITPQPTDLFDGSEPVPILLHLPEDVSELQVSVDGRTLRRGPAAATAPDSPLVVSYDAPRAEEGRKRLVVEAWRDGERRVLADQPLIIRRERRLARRDLLALGAAVALVALLLSRWRRAAPAAACLITLADLCSFGEGWQRATPREEFFPATATAQFLAGQPPPFRVFTESGVLPPDTQFVAGVDHLLARDGIGSQRTWQWLSAVPMDVARFAEGGGSRAHVNYASPRFEALDVRFVLTDLATDLGDVPGFRLVHESETRVWEQVDSLGRAWVVGAALDLLRDEPARLASAHPGQVALLETSLETPLGGRGIAHVSSHEGSVIRVSAEVRDGPALLVLAENRGPGWTASVNGGPAQATLAANVAWQAVPLDVGRHEIVFRLDSPAARWGSRTSLVCAVLLLFLLFLPRRIA